MIFERAFKPSTSCDQGRVCVRACVRARVGASVPAWGCACVRTYVRTTPSRLQACVRAKARNNDPRLIAAVRVRLLTPVPQAAVFTPLNFLEFRREFPPISPMAQNLLPKLPVGGEQTWLFCGPDQGKDNLIIPTSRHRGQLRSFWIKPHISERLS